MTQFKTLLITAALIAAPSAAFAQDVKDMATDAAKDIAVGTVVDAAQDMAKDMAQDKMKQKAPSSATTYTDGVTTSDVSAAGGMEAGKAMALEQAREKARLMSIEKAKENAATYGMSERDKAKRKLTLGQPTGGRSSGQPYVIQKSGTTMSAPVPVRSTPMPTQTQTQTQIQTEATPAPAVSTLNCPAGTKDAGDGTCMITGDWKP